MDIYETRRRRLQQLMNERFDGKQVRLADAVDRQPGYISRCLKEGRHQKRIGEEFARHIEHKLDLPERWLDHAPADHLQHDVDALSTPEITEDDAPLGLDEVELPYYREVELEGGCGRTQVIENHGRSMRFPVAKLLRAGVNPDQAACATLVGNSMEPKIMDGSPIGIDKGCTQIIDGKIYAIDHGGMLRVKRLYRLPLNRIRIASENSDEHPDEIVSPPELEELRVIGRVFWWESFD